MNKLRKLFQKRYIVLIKKHYSSVYSSKHYVTVNKIEDIVSEIEDLKASSNNINYKFTIREAEADGIYRASGLYWQGRQVDLVIIEIPQDDFM